MNRRASLVLLATALIAVGGVAAHGGLHGTHTTPRSQVVGDGAVVVDAVALNQEGYVVVRTDDGGRPGEPIGSVPLEPGIHEDVTVPLTEPLPDGRTPLWAAVHTDDGDGTFEPDDDPAVQGVVGLAASPFEVRTGDRSVFVLGPTERSQPVNDSVLINRVSLAEEGHLVVHGDDRNRLGEPIGSVSLSPGTHYNVEVPVNESAYPADREYFRLWAVVYEDDGDGSFDAEADAPVTVGDDPVKSRLKIRAVDGPANRTTVATPTPTATATTTPADGDGDGGTPSGTATVTSDPPAGTTSPGGGGPGFGVVVPLLSLAALLGIARRLGDRR